MAGFKLSKEQSVRWDKLHTDLQTEHSALTGAIEEFNKSIADAVQALQAYVDDYNNVVHEAKEFLEEVAGEWRSDFDEKSEGWQEGDKGQEVNEQIESMENYNPEDFELPDIEAFDVPADDAVEEFITSKPE